MPLFEYISHTKNIVPRMPIPNFNVLNSGVHSGNLLSCQEIMISFNKDSFAENLQTASIFYKEL